MARSYAVGAHFEAFIDIQVKSGRYASASEVLREGLRLLEDRDQRRLSRHGTAYLPAPIAPASARRRQPVPQTGPDEVEDRLAHLESRWRQGTAGTAD